MGPASANTPQAADRATGSGPLSSDIRNGVIVNDGVVMPGATGINADGERTGGASGNATASGNPTANGGVAGANGGPAPAAAGRLGSSVTPELDRATRREAQRTRNTAARKGQMLHSITPRTNVDRSDQMPDDPPSPAIATPDRPAITY
jgi:hypothetical protein